MSKDKNNIDDIPLTDLDYDGVVFEPSKRADKIINKNKIKKNSKNKIKKAQNFDFNIFITFAILLGLAVFGAMIFFIYTFISNNSLPNAPVPEKININNNDITPSNNDYIQNKVKEDHKMIVSLIKKIDYTNETITILDLKTNIDYDLKTKNSTEFKDKFDVPLTFAEFTKGDIVEVAFDSGENVSYIKKSTNSFDMEVDSVNQINLTNNTIRIDDTLYDINDNALILKDNATYDKKFLSIVDTLQIKGIYNNIYFIDVIKGNGILKIINKPNLTNATIEVNRDTFKSLNDVESLTLKEGINKIVVQSDDTNPYINEINIVAGTETNLDLSILTNRIGSVIINTNTSDYTVYIDDIMQSHTKSYDLKYGAHSIKIIKEGYLPFDTKIIVNKPYVNLNATLESIKTTGKLTISSTPDGAQVLVNNLFIGYTPLTYKLPYGQYSVILRKSNYDDFTLDDINIGETEATFKVTLHQNKDKKEVSTETTT